jgi:DNA-binding NarL/FixJ family response regulator
MFARMREMARRREESAFSLLTEQELKVLALLAEGKTNREIADVLVLGEGTVRNYVSSVFSKLHVNNRAEAAAYAAAHNIKDYM